MTDDSRMGESDSIENESSDVETLNDSDSTDKESPIVDDFDGQDFIDSEFQPDSDMEKRIHEKLTMPGSRGLTKKESLYLVKKNAYELQLAKSRLSMADVPRTGTDEYSPSMPASKIWKVSLDANPDMPVMSNDRYAAIEIYRRFMGIIETTKEMKVEEWSDEDNQTLASRGETISPIFRDEETGVITRVLPNRDPIFAS